CGLSQPVMDRSRFPALRSSTSTELLPSAATNSLWFFTSIEKWSKRPVTSGNGIVLKSFIASESAACAVRERAPSNEKQMCFIRLRTRINSNPKLILLPMTGRFKRVWDEKVTTLSRDRRGHRFSRWAVVSIPIQVCDPVPEGQTTIAQRFNVGTWMPAQPSPEGTAEIGPQLQRLGNREIR